MAWHASKSASGSKQWIECPGSLAYVASLPEDMRRPTGQAAMLGTCAHGLGEHCLMAQLREVPEVLMGTIVWLDEKEDAHLLQLPEPQIETRAQLSAELGVEVLFMTRIDDKMRDGVQLYLDVCWEAADEGGETAELMVEKRMSMDWLRPGLGGTADFVVWQFLGKLWVIDYKNGYVAVEAEDNTQALTYGLATAQAVDWMFEEMEVVIVQPNSRGLKVKRWPVTVDELKAFQERLAVASDKVDEAFETFDNPGVDFNAWASEYLSVGEDGKHCTFCDGQTTCPAAIAKAQELAVADFTDDPPEGNPLEVHDDDGLERLTKLIKWGKFLDNLVKAAKTLGQRRLEQGLEVPGHKLVEGKANRQWASTEGEVATLMVTAGFGVDDVYEPPKPRKLLSPAQMEKLGAARSAQRKKAKELVAGLAHKPPGKLTMAPEDDPRDKVEPAAGAADDFVDDLPFDEGDDA